MTLRVTIKPTATLMLRLAHLTIGISSAAFMIGGGAWNHAVAQHRELSKPAAAFSPKSRAGTRGPHQVPRRLRRRSGENTAGLNRSAQRREHRQTDRTDLA